MPMVFMKVKIRGRGVRVTVEASFLDRIIVSYKQRRI